MHVAVYVNPREVGTNDAPEEPQTSPLFFTSAQLLLQPGAVALAAAKRPPHSGIAACGFT